MCVWLHAQYNCSRLISHIPLLIDIMLFDAVSTSIGCKSAIVHVWCTQARCHGGGGAVNSEGTLYAESDIDIAIL